MPNTAESVVLGFLIGLVLGVLSGHFLLAIPPAVLGGAILGMLRVALGIIYDAATSGHR
jgi:hypothetical protein